MGKEVKRYVLHSGEVYFRPFPPQAKRNQTVQRVRHLLRWTFKKAPIRREYYTGRPTEFAFKVAAKKEP